MNFDLLKELIKVHAPSGDEGPMKEFILNYVEENKSNWKVQPTLVTTHEMQDCIMLKFGTPRTAIFAHMDSIGFTVRYGDELVKIGGPRTISGTKLTGTDSVGDIEAELVYSDEEGIKYKFDREIERGTSLVFKSEFREDEEFVQSCYLDNRLGVWNALKLAETLENGMLVFSCWEEHGGGSVAYLGRVLYEHFGVNQALISDITWVTPGVTHGNGVAISMRDKSIPRQSFIRKIIGMAKESGIPYQLEVEDAGGSDGHVLHHSPYPFNWCFIGAPEDHVHSPDEKVHKKDIEAMLKLYEYLMAKL